MQSAVPWEMRMWGDAIDAILKRSLLNIQIWNQPKRRVCLAWTLHVNDGNADGSIHTCGPPHQLLTVEDIGLLDTLQTIFVFLFFQKKKKRKNNNNKGRQLTTTHTLMFVTKNRDIMLCEFRMWIYFINLLFDLIIYIFIFIK